MSFINALKPGKHCNYNCLTTAAMHRYSLSLPDELCGTEFQLGETEDGWLSLKTIINHLIQHPFLH